MKQHGNVSKHKSDDIFGDGFEANWNAGEKSKEGGPAIPLRN